MTTVQCVVLLSVWTFASGVGGIRVPTDWNEPQENVRNLNYGIGQSHRFRGLNLKQSLTQNPQIGFMERRMDVESEQGNLLPETLFYSPLQPSPSKNLLPQPQTKPTMIFNRNGLYIVPQSNQETLPLLNQPITETKNSLPPLLNPRYTENPKNSNSHHHYHRRSDHTQPEYFKHIQKMPFNQNEAYENYQTLPSEVLRIRPTILDVSNFDKYKENMKEAQMRQAILTKPAQTYNPGVYKEYPKQPITSHFNPYTFRKQPLSLSLNHYVPQNHKFIVAATEEDSTLSPLGFQFIDRVESVDYTTKKEPVFFVTEGYRNVLVQGPNKKKKYIWGPYQKTGESRRVLKKQKWEDNDLDEESEDEDEEDDDKPPRKRKVTKIYRIHGHEGTNSNIGDSRMNLLGSELKKPRKYFERPQINTSDGKRSGPTYTQIKNYRDDHLHEPSNDKDVEKEDNDDEKIVDTNEKNDKESNQEDVGAEETLLTVDKETEDNKDDQPKDAESNSPQTEEEEEDAEQESDVGEENDDLREKEVPYSEHANPNPVPTKPIYPGEGQWAIPGKKHRPHVTEHGFIKPIEKEQKPNGHDVFEELEQYFESQKDKFGSTFGEKINNPVTTTVPSTSFFDYIQQENSPNPPSPSIVYDPFNQASNLNNHRLYKDSSKADLTSLNKANNDTEITKKDVKEKDDSQEDSEDNNNDSEEEIEENNEDGESSEEETDEFVPLQLYSQVRKSENEEHEPYDPLEHGRLREVIKDSKVQTVYTEEGYEDSAYDHAGHEKKAEQDQGYSEFEREKEAHGTKPLKEKESQENDSHEGQSKTLFVSDNPIEPLTDSLAADSLYPSPPIQRSIGSQENIKLPHQNNKNPKSGSSNNFITTQELKTTQVKDKNNGDVQLEIQSEVKVIVQPNNSTTAHRYVKIFPKVLKDIIKEPEEKDADDNIGDQLRTDEEAKNSTIEDTAINADEINKNTNATNDKSNVNVDHDIILVDPSTTESSTVSVIESITKNIGLALQASKNEDIDKVSSVEKPKVVVTVLDEDGALKKISDQFAKVGNDLNRKKRASGSGFEDVDIDTAFIDKINHNFTRAKPLVDVEKYPYYTMPDLNENSPLRYAENMDNIPIKQAGELSFYKMADAFGCPDIPRDIDPIPEHIKNADKNKGKTDKSGNDDDDTEDDDDEEESGVDMKQPATPKTPRIELGDKIDCLKARYFGENPLDSPFFKEETVGPVKSIFKELDRKADERKNTNKNPDSLFKSTIESINKANEIFNQKDERKYESEVKDKIFNALSASTKKIDETNEPNKNENISNEKLNTLYSIENEISASIRTDTKVLNPSLALQIKPTISPLVSLITTPKYTIELKPKNIYDQIKLLDHLPEDDAMEDTEATTTEKQKEIAIKKIGIVESNDGKDESSKRQSKILLHLGDKVEEKQTIKNEEDSSVLEPEALRRRKLRPRRPIYQIFDVNRFLTTTPFSLINTAASTVLPKYKVLSEVFYKDEIKPSEQLNVFADVLNNIKNSSGIVPIQSASDFAEPSAVTISSLNQPTMLPKIQQPPNVRVKKFQTDSSNQQNAFEDDKDTLQPPKRPYQEKLPQSYNIKKQFHINQTRVNQQPNSPTSGFTYNRNNHHLLAASIPTSANRIIVKPIQNQATNPQITKSGTKKILKRRRKPTISTTSTTLRTTTNIHVPNQNTPSNHQPYVIDFLEDSEEVVGLVPPQNFQYRTIMGDDSSSEDTNDVPEQIYEYQTILPTTVAGNNPAPVTEMNDEVPPKRSINKYFFLGLKPPGQQRVRPYSEFSTNNIQVNDHLLRRRVAHTGLSRAKRDAARPAYADVSRNRGRQNEGIENPSVPVEDDVDDYVPHRPKNYHYDEKTGKIVYHEKAAPEKPEEQDDEYEEIEIPDTPGIYLERADDATHPTPEKVTTKLLLATATPPPDGQGLLDFVVKLKNNANYQYIPDPTTPKPDTSTTEGFVTVDPKSTNPPEFLSILSKVKNDKTYKHIEDPKESQSKPKSVSTTPESISEEDYADDDEEEESLPEHIQNSPGGQSHDLGNLQIFDIGDYLPKIKTFEPKTSIDYSKYKTIERPHTRHNSSSKLSSDEEEAPKGKEEVVSRPPFDRYRSRGQPVTEKAEENKFVVMEEKESIDRPVVSEEKVENDMEVEARSSSTTQRTVQLRRGTRPTTQRITADPVEAAEPVATRRSTSRRRPMPSGFKTTRRPTTTTEVTESPENVAKIYPQNYYSERSSSDNHDKAKRVHRRRPVRIRHTTERQDEDDEAVEKVVRRSIDSKLGNEFEEEFLEEPNFEEKYDDIKEEIVNDDRHKANVDEVDIDESEVSESRKKEIVKHDVEIINKDFDKTQQHGGNYRTENEEEAESDEEISEKYVEGNTEEVESRAVENDNKNEKIKSDNIEIVKKDYDKTKKHGGNYRRKHEKEIVEEEEETGTNIFSGTEERSKKLDIDIIDKQFDQTEKHGGNYKTDEDALLDKILNDKEKTEETQQSPNTKIKTKSRKYKNNKEESIKSEVPTNQVRKKLIKRRRIKLKPITTTENSKVVSRLADVVPNPDHFYSDPALPKQVNNLKSEKASVKLGSEELAEVVDDGDFAEEPEKPTKRITNSRRRQFDEENDDSIINNDDNVESDKEKNVPKKKTIFVKDPSKRLYFYAPV